MLHLSGSSSSSIQTIKKLCKRYKPETSFPKYFLCNMLRPRGGGETSRKLNLSVVVFHSQSQSPESTENGTAPIQRRGKMYETRIAEPKLFETRSQRRNYLFNNYLLQSIWRMLGCRKTSIATFFL